MSELEVSCAVLWLLQLDEELLKLVPESDRLPALSAGLPVLALQAASLVRLGRIAETASAIEIIARPRLDNDGRPQLALAFLARLETLEGWSYSLVDTIANIDSHSESRIRNALYLARAALELLPYDAERHFALDLFVNCCLDLPASKRDPAMLDEGLSALSGNRASHWRSWFPRYDLTIIRCRIQGLSLDSKEKVEVCWLLYQCNDLLAQLPAGSEHDPMVGYYSGYIHHLMRAYECS